MCGKMTDVGGRVQMTADIQFEPEAAAVQTPSAVVHRAHT